VGGNWELFKTQELNFYTADYEITLPAGTYRLAFEGESFLNPGNPIREVYNDVTTLGQGTDIAVTLGQTVSGIDAQLGNYATGSIAGQVTDESGNPLPGIEVYIYNRAFGPLWDQVVVTDAGGNYTVNGLWPEAYFVEFYDPAAGYIYEYYDNAASRAEADRVVVNYGAVTGIDAALAVAPAGSLPGGITGMVTDESGNPVFGITVSVAEAGSGDFAGSAYTASDGTYRVRYLLQGNYTIKFSDPNGAYRTEWYDDAESEADADPVSVSNSTQTGEVDAALSQGGRITGTVTDIDGDPFPILFVNAFQFNSETQTWELAASGGGLNITDYELAPLPAGTYRIGFRGQFYTGNGYSEIYDNVADIEDGTDVVVIAGETTSGIDAVLGPDILGEINGTVTDGSGNPLSGITVRLTDFDFGFSADETTTAADGTYIFDNVYDGIYFVEFADPTGTYPGEWYNDAPFASYATPITVDEAPVTGIDAALDGANGGPGGGSITGRVTLETNNDPVPGVEVRCYSIYFDPILDCTTTTDANGDYFLGGFLPEDAYLVKFEDPNGSVAEEYYDDVRLINDATPISVTLGVPTTGIDAALTPAGTISGTLTGPDGTPLEVQSINAFTFNGTEWEFVNGTTMIYSDDPAYLLGGLPEGTYSLRFSGGSVFNQNQYVEYYDGVEVIANGTDIPVVAGQVTPNINAVLGDVYDGGITGRVTNLAGTGLDLVNVVIYRADGFPYRDTTTDAQGNYTLNQLPENNYYLGFFDLTGQYVGEYFDDQPTLETATAISVTNNIVSGIDAALSAESSITGRVADQNDDPLDFVQVTAFTLQGSDWITAATTFANPAGNYLLDDLPSATYRLEFMGYRLVPNNPPQMFVEYYDDQPSLASGTDIVLGDGQLLTGIDAQLGNLAPAGGINGAVLDMAGNGLAGMQVTVYMAHPAGQWMPLGIVTTNAAGNYTLAGLADHHYRICFTDPAGNYEGECYDDVTDMSRATDVVVAGGQVTTNIMAWLSGESNPPPVDAEHRLFIPIITN
jgi:protocatechuate 3,4-dioxygenase beta subunit